MALERDPRKHYKDEIHYSFKSVKTLQQIANTFTKTTRAWIKHWFVSNGLDVPASSETNKISYLFKFKDMLRKRVFNL